MEVRVKKPKFSFNSFAVVVVTGAKVWMKAELESEGHAKAAFKTSKKKLSVAALKKGWLLSFKAAFAPELKRAQVWARRL